MADNYLEKQREQYETRKAAWEKARKLGKRKSSSTAFQKTKTKQGTDDTTKTK